MSLVLALVRFLVLLSLFDSSMQNHILFTHLDELASQILVLFFASPQHALTMLVHFPKFLYLQLMLGLDDLLLSLICFLK